MEYNNICKFIPIQSPSDSINAINFVYERNIISRDKFTVISAYVIYLVTSGIGTLHTLQGDYELKYGDLFITFPAVPFSTKSKDNLQYMYITFLGIRANRIFDRLKITKTSPVFSGYEYLIDFWENTLKVSNNNNIDMLAESVLLYTFSHMSNSIQDLEKYSKTINIILQIKKYIDDNYSNSDLSLDVISKTFSYNSKYISNLFKKSIGIGLTEYIQTIRMQHACELMQQGITTIKQIAYLSGFKDPLYFSRVFKEKMRVSPKVRIKDIKSQKLYES